MPRSAAAEFAYLHRLSPEGALNYLKGRDKLTITHHWQDLWQEEHAHQFTVSRLTRLDILKAMQDGITASVNGDLTRRDWMRDMKSLLKKEGWWGEKEVVDPKTGETVKTVFDSRRLKLIFDTNTRQAYAAGHWQQIERAKKSHPYVRYITKRDRRVRDAHAAWDNLTLPVDDPFWDTHNPPCDLRCRCRVTTMNQADYNQWKEEGRIKTQPPKERLIEYVNPRTGAITKAPPGVNPGFAYNVGKAAIRARELARLVGEKIASSPAMLGAAFADLEKQNTAKAMDAVFAGWLEGIRKEGVTRHSTVIYGAMRPEELAAYTRETGITPSNAAIMMEDRLIVGRKAARHTVAGNALTDEEFKALPKLMRGERKVYIQLDNGNLIYLLPSEDDAIKLAIVVNFIRKKNTMNMTRSVFKVNPTRITNAPKKYKELK